MNNTFFNNNGPFQIDKLLLLSNIDNKNNIKNLNVTDIKDLTTAITLKLLFFILKNMRI